MLTKIKIAIDQIEQLSKVKPLRVISHYDTDGITSAAIFSRALQRWGKRFSLEVVKGLDENYIKNLPEQEALIFLDLASGSLDHLAKKNTEIFILDHHEVIRDIPSNVFMINPLIDKAEVISGAGVCYLFAKALSPNNRDLANLAVIGMVGDSLEKEIGPIYDEIIKDAEGVVKRGLLLYPSTRSVDKALEYSSNPYIPGVSGSYRGVLELLKEAKIEKKEERFKSLSEFSEEEMRSLITAIMLRFVGDEKGDELIGNIYLVKFFHKLEDARELSALINACSRMGYSEVALGYCLGNKKSKEEAEKIYIEYKQHLISALKYVEETEKIAGKNYAIINAKNNIKDTIIGTVASIISHSSIYSRGTMIIALAYNEDKIKVSARMVGKTGKNNVRDVLNRVVVQLGGEVGGHPNAAGCLISKEQEGVFIAELKKVLEVELSEG